MICLLGISYHTAELVVREEIARRAARWEHQRSSPRVLLSTCNRTEVYSTGEALAGLFDPHNCYALRGVSALRHLFRVAAGLDSAVLGETEIQRQLKLAYGRAGKLPAPLHFAFQKALKVGKEVRTRFSISRETLQSMIWRIVAPNWPNPAQKKILLIGYSDINRSLLAFFTHKGVSEIDLCSKWLPGRVCRLGEWDRYDLVVAATHAEGFLIQGRCRTGKRPIVIDLSVPRVVDPALEGVELWNIDQLIQQMRSAQTPVDLAEQFVAQQAERQYAIFQNKSGCLSDGSGIDQSAEER